MLSSLGVDSKAVDRILEKEKSGYRVHRRCMRRIEFTAAEVISGMLFSSMIDFESSSSFVK